MSEQRRPLLEVPDADSDFYKENPQLGLQMLLALLDSADHDAGPSGTSQDTLPDDHTPLEGSSAQHDDNMQDLEMQISPRLTTKQRILNVVHRFMPIKQTYERINNGLTTGRMQTNMPGRFIGQGTDGVFRNLMAKPDTESNRNELETHPPSYEEAAADSLPEYWESTVISPMYEDEVFVEGLPAGDIASFVWNTLVCVAFPYVGFFLCYLFHTSHAAKQGSRTGLGITWVMSGFDILPQNFGHPDKPLMRYKPQDPNNVDVTKSLSIKSNILDTYSPGLFKQFTDTSTNEESTSMPPAPYFAYGLIAFGIFVICKAMVDYYKMKKMEREIVSPSRVQEPVTSITEEEPGERND